jgi:hypothetical protein
MADQLKINLHFEYFKDRIFIDKIWGGKVILKTFLESLPIIAFLFIVMPVVKICTRVFKQFVDKESGNLMPKTTSVNWT